FGLRMCQEPFVQSQIRNPPLDRELCQLAKETNPGFRRRLSGVAQGFPELQVFHAIPLPPLRLPGPCPVFPLPPRKQSSNSRTANTIRMQRHVLGATETTGLTCSNSLFCRRA